jgi:rare lipoprotein A
VNGRIRRSRERRRVSTTGAKDIQKNQSPILPRACGLCTGRARAAVPDVRSTRTVTRAPGRKERKCVLNHQNKHRSITTVLLIAAIAGVVATGAGIAPSLAKDQGDTYARDSQAHSRHTRHLGNAHHAGPPHHRSSKPQLTFHDGQFRRKADHNRGLEGIASVYHDRITASGERMDPHAMTAAHKSLPIGSIVTVHNRRNGRSVTVRINDRGPYVTGRVIDLSPSAARIIGLNGLAPVSVTVDAASDHLTPLSTVSRH